MKKLLRNHGYQVCQRFSYLRSGPDHYHAVESNIPKLDTNDTNPKSLGLTNDQMRSINKAGITLETTGAEPIISFDHSHAFVINGSLTFKPIENGFRLIPTGEVKKTANNSGIRDFRADVQFSGDNVSITLYRAIPTPSMLDNMKKKERKEVLDQAKTIEGKKVLVFEEISRAVTKEDPIVAIVREIPKESGGVENKITEIMGEDFLDNLADLNTDIELNLVVGEDEILVALERLQGTETEVEIKPTPLAEGNCAGLVFRKDKTTGVITYETVPYTTTEENGEIVVKKTSEIDPELPKVEATESLTPKTVETDKKLEPKKPETVETVIDEVDNGVVDKNTDFSVLTESEYNERLTSRKNTAEEILNQLIGAADDDASRRMRERFYRQDFMDKFMRLNDDEFQTLVTEAEKIAATELTAENLAVIKKERGEVLKSQGKLNMDGLTNDQKKERGLEIKAVFDAPPTPAELATIGFGTWRKKLVELTNERQSFTQTVELEAEREIVTAQVKTAEEVIAELTGDMKSIYAQLQKNPTLYIKPTGMTVEGRSVTQTEVMQGCFAELNQTLGSISAEDFKTGINTYMSNQGLTETISDADATFLLNMIRLGKPAEGQTLGEPDLERLQRLFVTIDSQLKAKLDENGENNGIDGKIGYAFFTAMLMPDWATQFAPKIITQTRTIEKIVPKKKDLILVFDASGSTSGEAAEQRKILQTAAGSPEAYDKGNFHMISFTGGDKGEFNNDSNYQSFTNKESLFRSLNTGRNGGQMESALYAMMEQFDKIDFKPGEREAIMVGTMDEHDCLPQHLLLSKYKDPETVDKSEVVNLVYTSLAALQQKLMAKNARTDFYFVKERIYEQPNKGGSWVELTEEQLATVGASQRARKYTKEAYQTSVGGLVMAGEAALAEAIYFDATENVWKIDWLKGGLCEEIPIQLSEKMK